jgi:hypothetical protein
MSPRSPGHTGGERHAAACARSIDRADRGDRGDRTDRSDRSDARAAETAQDLRTAGLLPVGSEVD